jgi:structural maintenance of chromosomes protein 6
MRKAYSHTCGNNKQQEEPVNLQALGQTLLQAEEELGVFEKRVASLHSTKAELEGRMGPLQEELRAVVRELKHVEEQQDEFIKSSAAVMANKQVVQQDIQHYQKSAARKEAELAKENELLENLRNKLRGKVENASRTCERVGMPQGWNLDRLKGELQTLEANLKAREAELGSREVVMAQYVDLRSQYDTAKKELNSLVLLVDGVRKALQQRRSDLSLYRRLVTQQAQLDFSQFMSTRRYSGQLVINHERGTLDLDVQSNDISLAKGARRDKDAKLLSGGEKSFSTVALLLSLWKSMHNPFRALDEFDVFMDSVNRQLTMRMMIENARTEAQKKQYIFITPQGIR